MAGGQTLEKKTLEFVQGSGPMLPALERILEGLQAGDKRDGVLKAKDAFGSPEVQAKIPLKKMKKSEFPKDAQLKVGDRMVAAGADAAHMNVILEIAKISGDDVEVKLIHPLADKDLKYAIEVVAVRDTRPPPVPAAALDLEEEK